MSFSSFRAERLGCIHVVIKIEMPLLPASQSSTTWDLCQNHEHYTPLDSLQEAGSPPMKGSAMFFPGSRFDR